MLPIHAYEKTVFSLTLSGGFRLDFDRASYDCSAGTAFVEPGGENHSDRIGAEGARVLVIEVESRRGFATELGRLLAEPRTLRDDDVGRLAWRLEQQLRSDVRSPLAVDSDALDLLGTAARPFAVARVHRPAVAWNACGKCCTPAMGTALRVGDLCAKSVCTGSTWGGASRHATASRSAITTDGCGCSWPPNSGRPDDAAGTGGAARRLRRPRPFSRASSNG